MVDNRFIQSTEQNVALDICVVKIENVQEFIFLQSFLY